MSVTTQWIEIDSDEGTFGAYLAIPHTQRGPGIVLIQEIFGVNEHIRWSPSNTPLTGIW